MSHRPRECAMPPRDLLLALLVCAAWAVNFLTSALALREVPPLLFTALRLALLGIVLAPVVSALNLSEVVLSGPRELLDGPLRETALATLRERTMPVVSSRLQLRMTSLGEDGALSGAAVLVLSGQLGVT